MYSLRPDGEYIGTNSSTLTAQIASIESCTQRVHDWLLNNGLHPKSIQVKAIAFYNPRSKPLAALTESIGTVSVAGSPIKLQTSIKNLSVYFDSTMFFDKHVSETWRLVFSYSCIASYSGFSYHWGFKNYSRSNSRLPTWFLQLSPGWHICFKSDSPSACPKYSCLSSRPKTSVLSHHTVLSDLHWLPVHHRISF